MQAQGHEETVGCGAADLAGTVEIGNAGPGSAAEEDDDIASDSRPLRLVISRLLGMDEAVRYGLDGQKIKDRRNDSQRPAAGAVSAKHIIQ